MDCAIDACKYLEYIIFIMRFNTIFNDCVCFNGMDFFFSCQITDTPQANGVIECEIYMIK